MHIIYDIRETSLYNETQQIIGQFENIRTSTSQLPLGDVIVCEDHSPQTELFIIERKSFADLLASIKDGRYEEQSYRLMHSNNLHKHNIIYIVEGIFAQVRSPQDKKIIMSSIISLNLFKGFSVYRTSSIRETAEWILSIASKVQKDLKKGRPLAFSSFNNVFSRGVKPSEEAHVAFSVQSPSTAPTEPDILTNNVSEHQNGEIESDTHTSNHYCSVVKKIKKENVTPENIGEILLCQIPGISSVIAIEIMKVFGNIQNLIGELQTSTERLENMKLTQNGKTRKIPKNVVENVKVFLGRK